MPRIEPPQPFECIFAAALIGARGDMIKEALEKGFDVEDARRVVNVHLRHNAEALRAGCLLVALELNRIAKFEAARFAQRGL